MKSQKLLQDFTEYCKRNPNLTFLQSLNDWRLLIGMQYFITNTPDINKFTDPEHIVKHIIHFHKNK
jgi:hypothetical protein